MLAQVLYISFSDSPPRIVKTLSAPDLTETSVFMSSTFLDVFRKVICSQRAVLASNIIVQPNSLVPNGAKHTGTPSIKNVLISNPYKISLDLYSNLEKQANSIRFQNQAKTVLCKCPS